MNRICGYISKSDTTNIEEKLNLMKEQIQVKNSIIANNIGLTGKVTENKDYIICFDGKLYNSQVLKNILVTKGFSPTSDIEIMLDLFTCFKEKALNYVNGIFALIILNKNTKDLFIAKDRLGIKPLYYNTNKHSIIFASEIKSILNTKDVIPTITKDELIQIFGFGPTHTPGKTFFKDIYDLLPGHYMTVDKEFNINIIKYWDFESKKNLDSEDEILKNVKYLVTDAVEKQLEPGICSMLSGGLDSSIVTTIAAKKHFPFKTFSINYEDNDKDFISNDYQQTKDSDFVTIMTNHLKTDHNNIYITQNEIFKNLYNSVIARDMPGMADIDSTMYTFCNKLNNQGITYALSGECSDEIFGGYPWYYKEHLKCTKGFPWALSENLRENLVKPGILDKNELTNYIYTEKDNAIKNIEYNSLDSFEREFRTLNYLTIKYFMPVLVERADRLATPNNISLCVPFADYKIFEYVYNISAKFKLGILNSNTPTEKFVLKEAFRNNLPNEIINRKKSPFPKTYSNKYLELLENELKNIIENKDSRIHEIVNINYLKELINTHGKDLKENLFGQLMTYPQTLAYIIQIEYWLTIYNIKIEI